jgi:hypothetical protein
VVLERGPLDLVSIIEDLLELKSNGSGSFFSPKTWAKFLLGMRLSQRWLWKVRFLGCNAVYFDSASEKALLNNTRIIRIYLRCALKWMLSHSYFQAYTKFNRSVGKGNVTTFHVFCVSPFAAKGFSCLLKCNWKLSNQLPQVAGLWLVSGRYAFHIWPSNIY